ncbi:MAG: hypothetical protein LBS36_00550 [Oscillospiraceae bacterium]|jgi:hypothetical protein|nr:hypothetical protein [Oscillospiraceae bacterium]
MKKFKKILCLLLTGVLLLTSMGTGIPAFAADDDSNGGENSSSELLEIEVKTDKSNYTTLGIATFHVTITNISDQTIENISAEALFDDLAPVKGSSETKKEATSLSPNESFSFSYSATINANKVNLNIFQKIFLWIVRLFNGGFTAKANNFDNGREYVENTKSVKFGNFTADNTVRVWYGNEGIVESDLLTIDQSDFSTTEVKQVLSGKINLKEDIKRLYYTIEYQTSIDEKVEYDIINYENGTWQAENLLFPENNKITIFAETESCIYSSKPINIYYDRGESYALDTNHISYDEDYDGYYVNNLIIIDFEQGVSEERKNEIVQAIQGQVVGKINTIDELHVEVSPRNLVELENLCDILMKYDEVSFADWNEVHQTRSLSTPNDLWGYDKINPPIWNEENPA